MKPVRPLAGLLTIGTLMLVAAYLFLVPGAQDLAEPPSAVPPSASIVTAPRAPNRLGVALAPVSAELAKRQGRAREGALVTDVVPNGPAARAGVRAGDVIVAFGGTAVRGAGELPGLTARTPAGSEVDVSVVRDGREQTVKIRLGELPRP